MIAIGAVASEAVDGGGMLSLGGRGEALGMLMVDVPVADATRLRPYY